MNIGEPRTESLFIDALRKDRTDLIILMQSEIDFPRKISTGPVYIAGVQICTDITSNLFLAQYRLRRNWRKLHVIT